MIYQINLSSKNFDKNTYQNEETKIYGCQYSVISFEYVKIYRYNLCISASDIQKCFIENFHR